MVLAWLNPATADPIRRCLCSPLQNNMAYYDQIWPNFNQLCPYQDLENAELSVIGANNDANHTFTNIF